MRAPFRTSLVAFATLLSLAVPAGAEQACASGHVQARLAVFSEGSLSAPLYWAAEDAGQKAFTVQMLDTSCDGSTVTVTYAVRDGSATTPFDYTFADSGQVSFVNQVGHPTKAERNVSITDDPAPLDAAIEVATVVLTGMSGGTLVPPTSAPLIIVDDDGPAARFSLFELPYEENETSGATTPAGGVPVFRAGDAAGAASISYTLSGGTATPGADYQAETTGTLTFAAGDRVEVIPVQVVDDAAKETSETLNVAIDGTGVEDPRSATFTITDNEESLAPSSTLHHPRQNWKYRASDYRLREIHIFTNDEGGAGVVESEFALRRNMSNKTCAWWTGKKFKKGKCSRQRWLNTDEYEPDFYFIRLNELSPSVGAIKNYTAYSRAMDGAHNLETILEVGRNENTFEVEKPK